MKKESNKCIVRVHLVLLNAHLYVGINPDVRSMMRWRKALLDKVLEVVRFNRKNLVYKKVIHKKKT